MFSKFLSQKARLFVVGGHFILFVVKQQQFYCLSHFFFSIFHSSLTNFIFTQFYHGVTTIIMVDFEIYVVFSLLFIHIIINILKKNKNKAKKWNWIEFLTKGNIFFLDFVFMFFVENNLILLLEDLDEWFCYFFCGLFSCVTRDKLGLLGKIGKNNNVFW